MSRRTLVAAAGILLSLTLALGLLVVVLPWVAADPPGPPFEWTTLPPAGPTPEPLGGAQLEPPEPDEDAARWADDMCGRARSEAAFAAAHRYFDQLDGSPAENARVLDMYVAARSLRAEARCAEARGDAERADEALTTVLEEHSRVYSTCQSPLVCMIALASVESALEDLTRRPTLSDRLRRTVTAAAFTREPFNQSWRNEVELVAHAPEVNRMPGLDREWIRRTLDARARSCALGQALPEIPGWRWLTNPVGARIVELGASTCVTIGERAGEHLRRIEALRSTVLASPRAAGSDER